MFQIHIFWIVTLILVEITIYNILSTVIIINLTLWDPKPDISSWVLFYYTL